ncbi:major facilitator superfamily domain-containing protein [Aspergillus pseudoustus]|uniref:Major facilitator superfamily domain-containing protein n=1 Tax=Aspergillus pseudoustus TaxID=1810923 RepID=A0ABR4JES1_9EURO
MVAFAVSTDIFMYGLLVPVTPTALKSKLGIPEDEIQSWTSILLALYSAAFLVFSPVFGHLADRAKSRRWPLLFGLVVLGVATALLCIGTNIALWVVGRLFQGAAVALVWAVGLALLVDTVAEDELGQAIGYVFMGVNIGVLAGPLVGGVVYEHGGYYAVSGVAFALIGIDLVLRLTVIERKEAARWLVGEGIASTSSPQQGERSVLHAVDRPTDTPQAPQASKYTHHPLKQLATLLGSPRLLVSLWGTFLVSLVLTSFDSVLPLFVEEVFEWRQTGQGLIFIALVVPHFVEPLIGSLIDRHPGATRFLISGAFFSATAPVVLLRLITINSLHDKVILCVLLTLIGLCLAIASTPLTLETFLAVKEKEAALSRARSLDAARGGAVAFAFGLSNMAFAAGSLVGPFFAGYIRQRAGWETFAWAMGLIVGVSSVPTVLFSGGWIIKT